MRGHRPDRTSGLPTEKLPSQASLLVPGTTVTPVLYEGSYPPGGFPAHSPKRSRRPRKDVLPLVPAKAWSAIFGAELWTTSGSWAAGRRRRLCLCWGPGWDPGGRGGAGLGDSPLCPKTLNLGSISFHLPSHYTGWTATNFVSYIWGSIVMHSGHQPISCLLGQRTFFPFVTSTSTLSRSVFHYP